MSEDEAVAYVELTAAAVRGGEQADRLEVVFLESARFYELPRAHPDFEALAGLLRRAAAEQQRVRVRLRSPQEAVIEDVQPA